MAPEQAAADPHVDHRADIYAVGVLAYEIFSGAPPFGGVSPQHVIAAHMTRTPESISKQRPAVPAALDELVLRALEKRPADRWQTAEEMLSRLQSVVTPVPGTRVTRAQPVQKAFRLTENVCRRLDRAVLDPRIIGSDMQFLDNEVRSDTLVVLIHGTGQDASVFRDLMSLLPYRCIAPTLLGMEPLAHARVAVPLRTQVELLREQLRAAIHETNPAHTVLVGFSSGGDLALRLVAHSRDDSGVAGILSLAGNLALETCFVTRVFMKLGSVSEAELLGGLQRFGNDSRTLEEWLKVHEYLIGTFRKFGTDLEPVRRFSSDYARSYEENPDLFVEYFRAATARVPIVRCVFEDAENCRRILQDIRLRNVDDPTVLGDRYKEDALAIAPQTGHFDFLRPDVFQRHLADVVAAARVAARRI
jgi:pimeloyl-ACP methyl ester carboxylesterase